MKSFSLLLLAGICSIYSHAQLQSPEQFLGYSLGFVYTPHFKLVNYCNYLAQQMPDNMRLEKYGETNEGRPLLLLYVSSKPNLSRLEEIRKNNIRLANVLVDKIPLNEKAPAIVWLSYNVHGNEPSSSEAAMLTAYELLNPSNTTNKNWLNNTVVIIDPCLNPDGRDRYVSFMQQTTGRLANPYPLAQEHIEPLPTGRTNHYNFDLNRDWAWQTQVESQQRMIKYHQWLPQVHVDFHEQDINDPYFFAPAAEPFHEVITPSQRNFQTIIGKNNAKYFDQNGWLYFTKERFDLFYPSYGDTYPTYNGAIGMTYEQAGNGAAGLSVLTNAGDTLTLKDRLMHHYTTGMATIEIVAQQAPQIVAAFKKYFTNATQTPASHFKSYLIKNDGTYRIKQLQNLLIKNNILWRYAAAANYSGLNYFTGRAESFKADMGDIYINANQPMANLIKVLFERNSKLSDSVTYDITAWSLPFAYGLKTYGLQQYITNSTAKNNFDKTETDSISTSTNVYAYLIKWDGLNSAQFLATVLQQGIKVRYAEQALKIDNKEFDKGTLIVTQAGNQLPGKNISQLLKTAAAQSHTQLHTVSSGWVDKGVDLGSAKVHFIKPPKMAILVGSNVYESAMGEWWHFFDRQLNYPVSLVNAKQLDDLNLADINVLVISNGDYLMFANKDQNEHLKEFVRKGGKIIALEKAVVEMSRNDWDFTLKGEEEKRAEEKKTEEKKDDYTKLKKYENRERDEVANSTPGSIYKVEMDISHPLGFGYKNGFFTLKQDDRIYEFLKGGWNVGVIKKDNYVSGFTGSKAKEKLKDGTLFGVINVGKGSVVLLADNPMFRSFWENGKLLVCNAVFMVGQ
jgi:hypothetical protein